MLPMLSMTTDYARSDGCPEPELRGIAEAGFTYVHWCHHWCTDFVYHPSEVEQVGRWLRDLGLGVTDLHGSAGEEKCWTSFYEHERRAGVELVANRIEMAAALGSDVVIMHAGGEPDDAAGRTLFWRQLRRSLDALEPVARRAGVRLAIENGDFRVIERLFENYGADYLGLCYDAGHGNLHAGDVERFDRLRDRLISIHLHDNHGVSDQHLVPFAGTVDWPRVMGLIARSSYGKWVNLECSLRHSPVTDPAAFLAGAFGAAVRLAEMLECERGGGGRR